MATPSNILRALFWEYFGPVFPQKGEISNITGRGTMKKFVGLFDLEGEGPNCTACGSNIPLEVWYYGREVLAICKDCGHRHKGEVNK